jgi:AcrR family transcriptional regulator
MEKSIPYEATGRTRQKSRTHRDLIEAARALISAGTTPTVEETAAAASVSRTTAYRYFPTQRDLLVAAYPAMELTSLLGADAPADAEARLDQVVNEYLDLTIANEAMLRTALWISLDPGNPNREKLLVRKGRVITWLEDALAPLRGTLTDEALGSLVRAIRAAAGIEALVWLTDIAGLSREEAKELMSWSARALLQAAVTEANSNSSELAPD